MRYNYVYYVWNNASLTLSNTSAVSGLQGYNSANITLIFCNVSDYLNTLYLWNDANLTAYYSDIFQIYAGGNNNVTISNTTCEEIELYSTSYANVINSSTLNWLNIYAGNGYYESADSTINNFGPP